MSDDLESPQQKKFRSIREACADPTYMREFVLRVLDEFYRSTNTDPSLVPAGLKNDLAQVRKPSVSEKKAMKLLGESVLKTFSPSEITNMTDGYKAGYAVATVLKFGDLVKGENISPAEKHAIYSIVIAAYGLGNEVNEITMGQVDEKTAVCRNLYARGREIPEPIAGDFWNGFTEGNQAASLAETVLKVGPESAKFRFLLMLLGEYNSTFRNPSELQEFVKSETTVALKMTPESFKRERNRVSWRGAKYSRSKRKKKLGDKGRNAVP